MQIHVLNHIRINECTKRTNTNGIESGSMLVCNWLILWIKFNWIKYNYRILVFVLFLFYAISLPFNRFIICNINYTVDITIFCLRLRFWMGKKVWESSECKSVVLKINAVTSQMTIISLLIFHMIITQLINGKLIYSVCNKKSSRTQKK